MLRLVRSSQGDGSVKVGVHQDLAGRGELLRLCPRGLAALACQFRFCRLVQCFTVFIGLCFSKSFSDPGRVFPPTYRIDSGSGQFGVLDVGLICAGAIAETLLRNPQRLMVATAEITDRAAAELTCRRAVRVVKLYGAGLQTIGSDKVDRPVPMSRARGPMPRRISDSLMESPSTRRWNFGWTRAVGGRGARLRFRLHGNQVHCDAREHGATRVQEGGG